jgi:hypothetical protein
MVTLSTGGGAAADLPGDGILERADGGAAAGLPGDGFPSGGCGR